MLMTKTKRSLEPGLLTFTYIDGVLVGCGYCQADGSVLFRTPPDKLRDGAMVMFLQADDDDWDSFYEQYDQDAWDCERCGGEGHMEYNDCPEVWGEDCPSEVNHLVECPTCREVEREKNQALGRFLLKRHQNKE